MHFHVVLVKSSFFRLIFHSCIIGIAIVVVFSLIFGTPFSTELKSLLLKLTLWFSVFFFGFVAVNTGLMV